MINANNAVPTMTASNTPLLLILSNVAILLIN